MRGKYEAPRKKGSILPILAVILVIAIIIVGVLLVPKLMDHFSNPDSGSSLSQNQDGTTGSTNGSESQPTETQTEPTETEPPTTEPPEPVHVVSTATITSTGDVLMHLPVINTGLQSDGSYDFESIFRYAAAYTSGTDYMVGNLETTLCGTGNGYKYSGYPSFNCPDEIVDAMKDAGFDMVLTANNHCYDTSTVGLLRTLEIIEDRELQSLGTMTTAEDPKYQVVDINGINIGMICYTYSTTGNSGRPMINGLPTKEDAAGLINTFTYGNLDAFYSEVSGYMDDMKEEGAEAIVLYIHWGEEYQLKANGNQTAIAQKLCDLGVDVIVGGHPHVVQPMDLLTSTVDGDHKTVCLYSMGNAVSNQRLGNISYVDIANTEDGVLFSVTFSKYSDGTVYLESTELIPCWVNMHYPDKYTKEYNILPLDAETQEEWKTLYSLSDYTYNCAVNSYDRTMKIVGEGLTECKDYLSQAKEAREAAYWEEAYGEPMPAETTGTADTADSAATTDSTDSGDNIM